MGIGSKYQSSKLKNVFAPPTPPPLPPKPNFLVYAKPATKPSTVPSVTNEEIAKYWRQKRMDEEDHLLAAIKAAARIRAHNLSEDDYRRFEESLNEEEDDDDSKENKKHTKSSSKKDENSNEIRVGIKDWWTKSKYAYLNQPAIQSMDIPKPRASTYTPQFYCYKSAPPPATTTTFGIF